MTRPIKFRAWDTKRNKMYLMDEFHYDGEYQDVNFSIHLPDEDNEDTRWNLKSEELVLLQFTGLLDKNSKEIYEGDIVRGAWHWTIPTEVNFYSFFYDIVEYGLDGDNLEVIGNIYENPELLESPKEDTR